MVSTPLRLSLLDGTTRWRSVPCVEHAAVCEAFNLDPVRTRIDWPREHRPGNVQEGVVFFAGEPIGRMWVAREGDTFRELDPTSRDDFWREQHVDRRACR